MAKEILDMDATGIAARIRRGEHTAREAVEIYIRHLLQANDRVNCLTQDRFAEAREEAERADQQLREGVPTGKLHGVPISVKDCFHVAGMRTTGGLRHRRELVEAEDAEVVARLRREGAIIIGKTNTPPLCFCQETDNKLHGRTNNPWDLERTAGGSSGGEGACIALGGAAVGIGADIGGSIRFPSHFNGIVGFKSGDRQVPARGNFPDVAIPEQDRMLGIGAMAKSVRDARLIDGIIAHEQPPQRALYSFRIVMPGRQRGLPLDHATEQAIERLRSALALDLPIDDRLPPYFAGSALVWQQLMSIDGARHIRALMTDEARPSPLREYVRELRRNDSEVHKYLSWALIGANMFKPSRRRLDEIRGWLRRGDEELGEYLAERIVILPVYHTAAPRHGRLYQELFSVRRTFLKFIPYVAYANVWGLPSLTVPLAEDADGLPIGVQIISSNGNEEALFQLGEIVEALGRGYVRCRRYDQAR